MVYLESITNKVDWGLSAEKLVLWPVERIEYLGVYVSQEGISPKIARIKSIILDLLETPLLLSTKQREIIAGTNNYCIMLIVHNATLNVAILKNVMLVTKNLRKVTYLYDTFR